MQRFLLNLRGPLADATKQRERVVGAARLGSARGLLLLATAATLLGSPRASAVIFDATNDPRFNTTAPTDELAGSGWQYLGLWGGFVGTPVAPRWFVTARHVGGSIGDPLTFDGREFVTDSLVDVPGSDLRLWHVAADLPRWAPLYKDRDEQAKAFAVFGRGTQRGEEVYDGAELRGWLWGVTDGVLRWGTNHVDQIFNAGSGLGDLLLADFDHVGGTEAHLSSGDSSGALFIHDAVDGRWELAGINYGVTPLYEDAEGNGPFFAALFEQEGFFTRTSSGFAPASGPGWFVATRISSHAEFIELTVPEPSAAMLLALGAVGCIALRRRRSRG